MAVKGRKPKPEGQAVHRVKPIHEWIEVPNVPNENAPKIPRDWPRATQVWFNIIRKLPHTAIWGKDDWLFLFDSALVHIEFNRRPWDTKQAVELRRRTALMGVGFDARRNLKIRYIDVDTKAIVEDDDYGEDEDNVINLDDFKRSIV